MLVYMLTAITADESEICQAEFKEELQKQVALGNLIGTTA
jgi:hypothetical protein